MKNQSKSITLLCITFLSLWMTGFSARSENVPNQEQFFMMLLSQQMMYEHCRSAYPVMMQKQFGQEQNAFQALAQKGKYDQGSLEVARQLFASYGSSVIEQKRKSMQKEMDTLYKTESRVCDLFLKQKTGVKLEVKQILYDKKTLKFYINIQDQWLQADIDGYGLGCDCKKETKIQKEQKLRAFIEKAKNYILPGDSMYMSPNSNDPRVSYMRLDEGQGHAQSTMDSSPDGVESSIDEIASESVSDLANETARKAAEAVNHVDEVAKENNLQQENLGLEFGNIRVIAAPDPLNLLTLFYNKPISVYYECEFNYRDQKATTCITQLVPYP
ncbi:hypothetical protein [Acinetobacter bouvetii]|uniref:DUF1311 domain-containing protein n=1 Tax=Acinetobacter bouvetii TaxID=202951 RepID=A0A811GA51_9GAMM|nr:hypothetical protein [Acinetobacter bouvetii]CAB1209284.1 hypothetical protein SFB21_0544 [Acinetobacter bouvetii]